MKKYYCTDGFGDAAEIWAVSARAAASQYVSGGDWGPQTTTLWHRIRVRHRGDEEVHTVTVHPPEPPCEDGFEHEWEAPYSVLGGLHENPGVEGHGGGVVITRVCAICGRYREKDTWAQNPENGEQGLTSVEYRDADEASRRWIAARTSEAVEE